jgi:hypothetical protein
MRPVAVFLIFIIITGCTYGLREKWDKNFEKIPLHLLTIGDTKQIVEKILGAPVNVIGAKSFKDGIVEVWAYEKWRAVVGPDYKEEEYWLYFFNGKLSQWGRPGDWKREADRIYEFRVK